MIRMKNETLAFYRRATNTWWKYAMFFTIIMLVWNFCFEVLLRTAEALFYIQEPRNSPLKGEYRQTYWWLVLLAPLLETLVFQAWPWETIRNKKIAFGVSIISFALVHFYTVSYVFYALISGVILLRAYIGWKGQWWYKFLMVSFIHFLHNLTVVLVNVSGN